MGQHLSAAAAQRADGGRAGDRPAADRRGDADVRAGRGDGHRTLPRAAQVRGRPLGRRRRHVARDARAVVARRAARLRRRVPPAIPRRLLRPGVLVADGGRRRRSGRLGPRGDARPRARRPPDLFRLPSVLGRQALAPDLQGCRRPPPRADLLSSPDRGAPRRARSLSARGARHPRASPGRAARAGRRRVSCGEARDSRVVPVEPRASAGSSTGAGRAK